MATPHKVYNPILRLAFQLIQAKPGHWTINALLDHLHLEGQPISRSSLESGINRWKKELKLEIKPDRSGMPLGRRNPNTPIERIEQTRPPIDTTNVLFIGDPHAPFTHKGYLEWNLEISKKYGITHVIFAGDVIDNHATSLHDPDPDLHSPSDELQRARAALWHWHEAFPYADVCTGNHEARIYRIATKNRISRAWLQDYATVLNTPTWNFANEFIYDNVHYLHGEGANAERRALMTGMSTVCGDKHTQMYVKYLPHEKPIFAVQSGCGLDRHSKAAAYAINHPPQILGSAVILEHGTIPLVLKMP